MWDVASQSPVAVAQSDQPCRELHFLKRPSEPRFIAVATAKMLLWELRVDGLHQTDLPAAEQMPEGIRCSCLADLDRLYCVTASGQLMSLRVRKATTVSRKPSGPVQDDVLSEVEWDAGDERITAVASSGHELVCGTATGRLLRFR